MPEIDFFPTQNHLAIKYLFHDVRNISKMKVTLLRDTYSTNYFTWSTAMSYTELEPSRHFLPEFGPQWALQVCLNWCLFIFIDTVGRCEHHPKTTWAGEHFILQEENLLLNNLFQSTALDTMGQAPTKGQVWELPYRQHRADKGSLKSLCLLDPRTTFSPPCSRLHMATLQAGTAAAQWPRCGYI